MPSTASNVWVAMCIGDAQEILRLLTTYVSHIGKRRGVGFGEVMRWRVEDAQDVNAQTILIRDGALARPVPLCALPLLEPYIPTTGATRCGWTPPQWCPSFWADGWSAGTPITHTEEAVCV